MRHRLHISQLMYVPVVLIILLYVGVYGGAVWAMVKVVEHVARKHIESNDSVLD